MEIIRIGHVVIAEEALRQAVWEAHRRGYANEEARYHTVDGGAKRISFGIPRELIPNNPNGYLFWFTDYYAGPTRFTGCQFLSIWFEDREWRPIWGMSYAVRHCLLRDREEADEAYAFLRKALRANESPMSVVPQIRGLHDFQEGEFVYRSRLFTDHHSITDFVGDEEIIRSRTTVYVLDYQGGLSY